MCRYSAPPGYVRSKAPERPKLGPLVPVIDAILEADKTAPPKQRHTAKRIFERLRIERGFAGGYTVVKDYVRIARTRSREVFVPLAHPPGHAQVDFGECVGVIGGVRMKLHVFCFDLPQSDACFIKAYPAETTEAFLDGHVSAFVFFGGVPISIFVRDSRPRQQKSVKARETHIVNGLTPDHTVCLIYARADRSALSMTSSNILLQYRKGCRWLGVWLPVGRRYLSHEFRRPSYTQALSMAEEG